MLPSPLTNGSFMPRSSPSIASWLSRTRLSPAVRQMRVMSFGSMPSCVACCNDCSAASCSAVSVSVRAVGIGAHHAVDLIFGERLVGLDSAAHSTVEATIAQAALKGRERIVAAQFGLVVHHPLRLAVGQPDHAAFAPAGLFADPPDEIERDRTGV